MVEQLFPYAVARVDLCMYSQLSPQRQLRDDGEFSFHLFLNSSPAVDAGGKLLLPSLGKGFVPKCGSGLIFSSKRPYYTEPPQEWVSQALHFTMVPDSALKTSQVVTKKSMQELPMIAVSLGSYCATRASIDAVGLGAEFLPFDWIRTTLHGVIKFLRDDFEGYFQYSTKMPVSGTKMVMLRSSEHSFWHHDVDDPDVRAKLQRRIERLRSIKQLAKPIIFVRSP